ncbi:MAG: hypothetical protein WC054_00420 [Candidatus Nanopelagicales bacterium]
MTTSSVSQASEVLRTTDGVVLSSAWTEDCCRELLRILREIHAAPDNPEAPESDADSKVAARVFHEVLSLHPGSEKWPLFSGEVPRRSLYKAAIMHARSDELAALTRLSDSSALWASNVSRWMLRMPQQTSPTMVFTPPPGRALPEQRRHTMLAKPVALSA